MVSGVHGNAKIVISVSVPLGLTELIGTCLGGQGQGFGTRAWSLF